MEQFEEVQDRFNRNMAELYIEDMAKKKQDREFLSVNSFLMTRRDYIFTGSQMKKLLMMIGLTKREIIVADIKVKITQHSSE